MTNTYTLGTEITGTARVRNRADTLIAPGTITATVTKVGGGTVPTTTPITTTVGVYTFTYEPLTVGTYTERVVTTNPDSAAERQIVIVSLV